MSAQIFTILSFIASIILLASSVAYFLNVKKKAKEILSGNKAYNMQKKAEDNVSEILSDAQEKAKKLLTDTEFIKKSIIQDLDANLQRIAATSIKQLEDESQAYNNQYKALFDSISHEHQKMLEQLEDTLKEIQSLKEKMLKEFEDSVKQVTDGSTHNLEDEVKQYDVAYRLALDQVKESYLKKAEETISVIEKIPENEVREYSDILKKETLASQQTVEKEIGEELSSAQKEIESYKGEKMKEIGDEVDGILHKVTKDVLAKSLTEEEHKKLIEHALERAQAEGVLGGQKTSDSS